ncbi:MAG: hypothetical protein LBF95_09150, partial [Treponema sp.]|nr:hypothetical protein [Treponema sp.]
MKLTAVVLVLLLILLYTLYPAAAGAQEEAGTAEADEPFVRVVVMPEIKVHVSPPENGTEEEVTYFLDNFKMELVGAAYAV